MKPLGGNSKGDHSISSGPAGFTQQVPGQPEPSTWTLVLENRVKKSTVMIMIVIIIQTHIQTNHPSNVTCLTLPLKFRHILKLNTVPWG